MYKPSRLKIIVDNNVYLKLERAQFTVFKNRLPPLLLVCHMFPVYFFMWLKKYTGNMWHVLAYFLNKKLGNSTQWMKFFVLVKLLLLHVGCCSFMVLVVLGFYFQFCCKWICAPKTASICQLEEMLSIYQIMAHISPVPTGYIVLGSGLPFLYI